LKPAVELAKLGAVMTRVNRAFLSYRRSDSDYALLLYEFLKQNFGREGVFLDTDYIEPGENFVETLERELESCGAFVALIGRGWIDSLPRLQEERDFVRMELATILTRKAPLVPVLAGGAKMPKPDQLPPELAVLPQLSAVEFRVHDDLEALVRAIGKAVPLQKASDARPDAKQRRVLELLKQQVHRINSRADELIGEKQIDRAFDELNEGIEVLVCLQEWSPAEVQLTLHLGYLYKTTAQAFQAAGDNEQSERYFDLAASVFEQAKKESAKKYYSPSDLASAINGLGNIQYHRGDLKGALENYRLAVTLTPDYAYAWHDLFGAYVEQAKRGDLNLAAMREAYENARRTGLSTPGLSEQYLNELGQYLRYWEQQAAGPKKPRTVKKRR
jgi:tetratricopeptide (TPR) repeat protein